MFDLLLRYVCGFIKVSAKGIHINRFLNLCKTRGIRLWKPEQTEDSVTFFVSVKDAKALAEPAKKTGTDVTVIKKYGLFHFLRRNKKRVPFVVGFVLFAICIYIQSLFIWNISVTGESDYTAEEIIQHVKLLYVADGTRKSEISCEELERSLRNDFTDIAWISCSIEGTCLSIELTETLNVFTNMQIDTPCNIIASEDCTIDRMVTAAGTPVVTIGDDVKKGDILISGAVYLYDDNNEVLDTNYVSAEGQIYGICTYPYKTEIPCTYYKKEYTGEEISYRTFSAFDYRLTPYVPDVSYENYDLFTDIKKAKFGNDFYLPFSIEKVSLKEYRLKSEVLTKEEATERAEEKLRLYMNNLQEKGVQIIENNVKITWSEDVCLAEGDLVVCKPVGVPQELQIVNEENTLE